MTRRISRSTLALISAGALIALAGCGGPNGAESPGGTGSTENGGNGGGGDVVEIDIIAPSNPPSDAGFEAVTAAFNEAHPEIRATYTGVSDYETTRAARMTSGNADVVACNPRQPLGFPGEMVTEDTLMAQEGIFVDLTDQPFMDYYLPTVLESPGSALDGQFYAVPTGLSYATGVFYNKTLFDENGLSIPTTWAELETVMSTLQDQGVTPFGWGGLDAFPAALPLYGIIASYYPTDADKFALLEGIWDGSVDLTSGDELEILERVQVIFDNSASVSPGISVVESFGAFANGDFAMLFDGSWDQKPIADVVGSNFEFGMFPLPGGDNAEDNQFLDGKIEIRMCAVGASENQEAAVKWLDFLSQPENYATFVQHAGFAPAQPDIVTEDAFLDSIAGYTSEFSLFWEAVYMGPQEIASEGNPGFAYQLLPPLGNLTPLEAAQAAEAAWDAVR